MSKHVFENICIDFEPLLKETSISKILKSAATQAKTEEAKKRTDILHYKDYGEDEWSPTYFGMFVEWYAEQFLNHFGHLFNIYNVQMLDAVDSTAEDLGVDGMGKTMKEKSFKGSSVTAPRNGDIYIQVKGTLNTNKEHCANDGTRLPNFTTNAMSTAIKSGHAYQSRYLLFTTGKGVHYTLDKMWNGMVEIVDIKQIEKHTKNNIHFLNVLRSKVGLSDIEIPTPPIDSEAEYNMKINQNLSQTTSHLD